MISQAIFRKFCLLLLAFEGCECKRNWDYDPISLTGHSSDETKLKPDLRVERVGRYEAGFSGTLDCQYYRLHNYGSLRLAKETCLDDKGRIR